MRAPLALAAALLAACGSDAPSPPLHEPPVYGTNRAAIRPDDPNTPSQFHFDSADVVETFSSAGGNFLVHFTRAGRNAVPLADADTSGVPDFVESVAKIYEQVLTKYTALGFRAPVSDATSSTNGGDGKFDVYLVDFNKIGDGNYQTEGCLANKPDVCWGYMLQENDFAGYGYASIAEANRILSSHEFFHAVQAAYDHQQGSVIDEGTAVWATEQFDPSLRDFEDFIDGYLQNPDRSIDLKLPGPVDAFSYGSAIFFQFLSEKFGPKVVVDLWTACEDGANGVAQPVWTTALDALLKQKGTSFAEAFAEFAKWNVYTGAYANPAVSYQSGAAYPRVKGDNVLLPYASAQLRVFYASAQYSYFTVGGRPQLAAELVPPATDPTAADGLRLRVALFKSGAVSTVQDLGAGAALDVNGATGGVVFVVNGALSGSSKRPYLCLGSPAEVQACKDKLVPPAAGPDAGTPEDAGEPGPAPVNPEPEQGCGCAAGTGALPASFICGAALLLRRRRVWGR